MSSDLTLLLLGNDIQRVPDIGTFLKVPLSGPTHAALYSARLSAARRVETDFFSIVDGGPDLLLPEFELCMAELCMTMQEFGFDIGTARERIRGKSARYMHHGIVCRTHAFRRLNLPAEGCFGFQYLVYPMLTSKGAAVCNTEAYDWIPSVGGAAKWPDYPRAKINSMRWIAGLPPVPDMPPSFYLSASN